MGPGRDSKCDPFSLGFTSEILVILKPKRESVTGCPLPSANASIILCLFSYNYESGNKITIIVRI